jgi:drug/metabolite transporter (DMT)-like permease
VLAGLFLAVDLVLFNHAITDLGAGIATTAGNLSAVFVAALAWALLLGLAFGGLRLAISWPSPGRPWAGCCCWRCWCRGPAGC